MNLYHYTCDHGREALGDGACRLFPLAGLTTRESLDALGSGRVVADFVWLTDLPEPDREGLGLTSQMLDCDRGAHRYRVMAAREVVRYSAMAHMLPPEVRQALEHDAPGTPRPEHWWVSPIPVMAVYDPVDGA